MTTTSPPLPVRDVSPRTLTLIPRMRLDLSMADVAAGLGFVAAAPIARHRQERLLEALPPSALVALSVRSAFDAYLATAPWPAGSEILVSALTIPDMPRIIEAHDYVPVPVDLDLDTLVPTLASLGAAVGPRTVAWLHAHLFGTRSDLTPHAQLLSRRGVVTIEDCAQAYLGEALEVAPFAAASFFSFGTIKTATATGGAVACIRDETHLERMRSHIASWPVEPTTRRAHRVGRCGGLLALGHPRAYSLLTRTLRRLGHDPDQWVHAATRGFAAGDFFSAIRTRPSPALVALVERRLSQDVAERVQTRADVAERLVRVLPAGFAALGSAAPVRTHWVLPILSADPPATVALLRASGFDATSRSSLAVVGSPQGGQVCPNVSAVLERIVYVPIPRPSEEWAIQRLEQVLSPMTPVANVDSELRQPLAA